MTENNQLTTFHLPEHHINDDSNDEPDKKPKSFCEKIMNFPKAVYFCLGCEFSERFSFYGMRSIMTLYFITDKRLLPAQAKLLYHAFVCLAYFTPLLGSVMADGFFGKFKVIFSLSLIYCLGHALITVAALPMLSYVISACFDFAGFLIIAIASGGMRPCVAAFAGDQFGHKMVEERRQFFSFFYFAINLGGMMAIFIVPGLRFHVHCFGELSCFPLAFAVPSIFIALATVLFIAGRRFYVLIPPTKNIMGEVFSCVYFALKQKFTSGKRRKGDHWLDYASPKYPKQLIDDIKVVSSIIVLYLPIIVFWALYDQMGSTWILQANTMNGRLGRMTLLPDQMTIINAGLVLILVPIFEGIIYPCFYRLNMLRTSLRRMGWGGLITASTFVTAGFLQLYINSQTTPNPSNGQSRLMFYNAFEENVKLYNPGQNIHVKPNEYLTVDLNDPIVTVNDSHAIEVNKQVGTFVFFTPVMQILNMSYSFQKTESGQTKLYVLKDLAIFDLTVTIQSQDDPEKTLIELNVTSEPNVQIDLEPGFLGSNYFNVHVERSDFVYPPMTLALEAGSALVLVVLRNETYLIELVAGNSVNILWQFPQYFLITIAEILFSITGLEFSYSQAPDSMKAIVQAIWMLSGAFGNLLAALISGSNLISNPAWEFFLYAFLMYAIMVVFIVLARRYKYVSEDKENDSVDFEEQKTLKSNDT